MTAVGLTTLENLRLHVLRSSTDSSQDQKLTLYGQVMSDRVSDYCRRQFAPDPVDDGDDPVDHVFAYDGEGTLDLYPYELRASDDLAVNLYTDRDNSLHQAVDATQYRLSPRGGTPNGTYLSIDLPIPTLAPLHYGLGNQVTITGRWGMAAVPLVVELAVWIAVDDIMDNPASRAGVNLGGYQIQPEQLAPGFDTDIRGGLPRGAIWALAPFRRRTRSGTLSIRNPTIADLTGTNLPRP